MKKTYRTAPEVKEQILKRIKEEGIPVIQAAKEHGLNPATICARTMSSSLSWASSPSPPPELKKSVDQKAEEDEAGAGSISRPLPRFPLLYLETTAQGLVTQGTNHSRIERPPFIWLQESGAGASYQQKKSSTRDEALWNESMPEERQKTKEDGSCEHPVSLNRDGFICQRNRGLGRDEHPFGASGPPGSLLRGGTSSETKYLPLGQRQRIRLQNLHRSALGVRYPDIPVKEVLSLGEWISGVLLFAVQGGSGRSGKIQIIGRTGL